MPRLYAVVVCAAIYLGTAAAQADTASLRTNPLKADIPPPELMRPKLVPPPLTPIPDLKLTLKQAEEGKASAQYWMGQYYLYGWSYDTLHPQRARRNWEANDGAKNLPQAITWFERAAAQGERYSLILLPVLYGANSPSRDVNKAEHWLRQAAYADLPPKPWTNQSAWTRLDDLRNTAEDLCPLYAGKPFTRDAVAGEQVISVTLPGRIDYAKAVECRQYGVRVDNYQSPYALAYFYQYGIGTARDDAKAAALYRDMVMSPSGQLNQYTDPHALIRLGLIYAGQHNDKEAYLWLRLAETDTLMEKDPDLADINSPEAVLPDSPPDVIVRQKIYGLGQAALVETRTRLGPQIVAEQDALAAGMRSKQALVFVPVLKLDASLTDKSQSDEGIEYVSADLMGTYAFRAEPNGQTLNMAADAFATYVQNMLSNQTTRRNTKDGWQVIYRAANGKLYQWEPNTDRVVRADWVIRKIPLHAKGQSFDAVQYCNKYQGGDWTCAPASLFVALPEGRAGAGFETRRGDLFNLKSGVVPAVLGKDSKPKWPETK